MSIAQRKQSAGVIVLACLICCMLVSNGHAADSEAPVREQFAKDFKDKSPEKRIAAIKTLAGVQEEKSVALLASALKDPTYEVRRAAAQTLQGVTDAGGVAIKPLCAIVVNKKEETPLRLDCARALSKVQYKSDAIKALISAISIDESEVLLYAFGMECTKILNGVAGQDFGIDKDTPGAWAKWWKENQKKVAEEDAKTLAAYKKAQAAK